MVVWFEVYTGFASSFHVIDSPLLVVLGLSFSRGYRYRLGIPLDDANLDVLYRWVLIVEVVQSRLNFRRRCAGSICRIDRFLSFYLLWLIDRLYF